MSGGKDSHYQAYLMKVKYGMNPLFVTYNHLYNTKVGLRNLENMFRKFSCDLIRFSSNPDSARKISRYMLQKVGDVTWHYHAGIMTFPIQIAVKYRIPLMIWGEEGFSELTGMFNQDDMVEFTKKKRQEHDMRGFEPEDLLNQSDSPFELARSRAFLLSERRGDRGDRACAASISATTSRGTPRPRPSR